MFYSEQTEFSDILCKTLVAVFIVMMGYFAVNTLEFVKWKFLKEKHVSRNFDSVNIITIDTVRWIRHMVEKANSESVGIHTFCDSFIW